MQSLSMTKQIFVQIHPPLSIARCSFTQLTELGSWLKLGRVEGVYSYSCCPEEARTNTWCGQWILVSANNRQITVLSLQTICIDLDLKPLGCLFWFSYYPFSKKTKYNALKKKNLFHMLINIYTMFLDLFIVFF